MGGGFFARGGMNNNAQAIPQSNENDLFLQEFNPSSNRSQNDGLTKWQLEPSDVIEELEHYMRGDVWTEKGWKVIKDRRFMNDMGINRFLTIIRGHLSKIISMSELNDKEINRICYECRQAVIDEIYCHEKKFEIEKSTKDTLVMNIDHIVYCFIKQAKNGGLRRFLQTTERKIETFRENSNYAGEGQGEGNAYGGNPGGSGLFSRLKQKLF